MMRQETAEAIALKALGWLVANEGLLPVFLGSTGASVQDFREQAGDAEFLGSVLDFIMMDDAWVVQFCDLERLPYDTLMQARQSLPGGAQVNWT